MIGSIYSAIIAEVTDSGRCVRVQYDDNDTEWVRDFERIEKMDTTELIKKAKIGDVVGKC